MQMNTGEPEKEVAKPLLALDRKTVKRLWTVFSYLVVIILGLCIGRYAMVKMEDLDKSARHRWQPEL